ncbi:RICIN domain-containing protein [Actinophytocola oryzae]|uniref:Ricin-type beta-trefoil lectin protein n=1 Tax=Actinophytocola oryzae TaxID=502181 RepID=A0A4R7VF13_9PSEU|nr:RICIN domain-containing protein [Actinophytocola oryzae]TDV47802.1 ricin-type beta-trefoil lectin protein [Actinophytocola oryzae]
MTVQRRTFLIGGALATGAALLPSTPAAAATDRAALRPAAFRRLPPGAVRPQGWLATQLDKQLHGLGGRYAEVSDYLRFDQTGWVHPDLDGWEELPYWLRGYGDLGYVTGDATVLATTECWVDAVLATSASDGFFGPTRLRTAERGHADLWPHMPMLHALRSWAEYHDDARVVNVLGRFFQFTAAQPDAVFVDGWGHTRWGDTLDVIVWLYGRTNDPALLDLAHRIHRLSANWTGGIASPHNVNIAQGFREPAQYWQLSGDTTHRDATYRNYDTIMATYGQFPGGGFAGDENARPGFGDPRQGFETCGVVEFMASHELLTRLTGDSVWADRTEDLAFNSLPAALDPAGRVTHYVTSANVVRLDNAAKTHRQFQNGFAMQAYKPGIRDYRCCPHNYGQGWPYFVEEMWLGTPDGGLAAALYGPCTLTTTVVGTRVTITERTSYPFADTISLTFTMATPATFPLALRVPGWCANPALTVNGGAVAISGGPRFATVNRTWRGGDVVVLTLPMTPRTRQWSSGAVSVSHGALTFALRFDEQWRRYAGTDAWPEWEVTSGTAWNYGLTTTPAPAVSTGGNVDDPFTPDNAPVRLTVSAQRIPDWTTDSENVVGTLQGGQVSTNTPVERVALVPMGAARLRIATFPRTGGTRTWGTPGPACRLQNKNSGKVLAVEQQSTADAAHVVQFDDNGTADHLWRLVDLGNGRVKVLSGLSGKVLGIDGVSTANSAHAVQFTDNGTTDHVWELLDNGDGWFRLRNRHAGKVLGVDQMSTANSAHVVQFDDNGTADHLWRIIPDGDVRIQNLNSTKVLAVAGASTADSARVVQFADNGTADHLWRFLPDADGYFRIRNANSGKVLGVDQMSTADSAVVVQFGGTGTRDHLWRLRADWDGLWRLQNANSGKMLGVDVMSYADSAQVVQFADNGTADHVWRLL